MRYVNVTEFKGKKLVNIREFYNDASGDMKPGKKGMTKIILDLNLYVALSSLTDHEYGRQPEASACVKLSNTRNPTDPN
jgi:hypothetical protein